MLIRKLIIIVCSIWMGCTSVQVELKNISQVPALKATTNVNGYWYCKKFGYGKLVQTGNDINGSFRDYCVAGKAYGATVHLVLSEDNKSVDYNMRFDAGKEGTLAEVSDKGMPVKNGIIIIKESYLSIRERMSVDEYFYTINIFKIAFSHTFGMEPGRRWLAIKEGKADVIVDGSYSNPSWGGAVLVQKGNKVSGNLGVYEIEGVVNGKIIYLMIRYWEKLYFTAVLDASQPGKIMGNCYRGITYNDKRKGDMLLLMK